MTRSSLLVAIVFAVFSLCLAVNAASAQELNKEDPLNKPALWKKLSETPTNNQLWAEYFGKNFTDMSMQEKAQVNILRQKLLLSRLSDPEANETSTPNLASANTSTASTVKFDKPSHAEFANAEALIMQEQAEVVSLKENINENFTILEDMYQDLFADYGLKFVPYSQAHPDGKTPKINWVEDQEKQIKAAKMKRLEELKAKVGK